MGSDGILSALSFLTIIPVPRSGNTDISITARNMYLFPIVGAIIGIIVGIFAYGLSIYLENYLVGFFVTIAILLITGMQHADALADFADGLMVKGSKDAKRRAMSDPAVGTAGAISLVVCIIGLIIAISTYNSAFKLLISIVAAEVIAKYIMVIEAGSGRSAWEGFQLTLYKGDERQKENCICHHIYTHNSFNLERLHWIDLFGNRTTYRRCNLPPFN